MFLVQINLMNYKTKMLQDPTKSNNIFFCNPETFEQNYHSFFPSKNEIGSDLMFKYDVILFEANHIIHQLSTQNIFFLLDLNHLEQLMK